MGVVVHPSACEPVFVPAVPLVKPESLLIEIPEKAMGA
jgi:hypothetical protein